MRKTKMIHEMIISAIIFGAIGFCVGYFKLDLKLLKLLKKWNGLEKEQYLE